MFKNVNLIRINLGSSMFPGTEVRTVATRLLFAPVALLAFDQIREDLKCLK